MSVKSLNRLSYILAGLSILLIIIGCFAPFVFTQCGSLVDFTETGQIGDTIGGTMSPIVAIAGVFMTFIAFLMQINANRIQSEQLRKTFNLRLLENRIESRNALQLMSVDINVMIKEIDITCESIDTFCTYIEKNPTGEIPFYFTPKLSRSRYNSINRNLVYDAFSFMVSNDFLDDFRTTYSLMDLYSEGIDSLYSAIYKPYTDDIMKIKNKIPIAFEELCNAMNTRVSDPDLLRLFNVNMHERLIKDGILNVHELHKTLNDGRYSSLYDTNFNQYQRILGLTNSLITQNKMMVAAMRDAKVRLQKQETYERLVQLGIRIDTALSEHTIESIQKEFDKQI